MGKKETAKKERKPKVYPYFFINPNMNVDDIIKIGKITVLNYNSIHAAVASEIPTFLRWMEQIQSIILEQKAITDRKVMLHMDKDSQEKMGVILLSMIRQFSPDILYMANVIYPDELEEEGHKLRLIEHKLFEESLEMKVTRVTTYDPTIYKNSKNDKNKDISNMTILQHIGAKNIYTPLIIEKNSKGEKILSKFNLDYKGKGELYNYDRRLIARYPIGTIIFPFPINDKVRFIFEIKFKEGEKQTTGSFVVQFLKHLKNHIDTITLQSYVIKTCKGMEVLNRLSDKKDLTEISYKKKAIIFLDIYDYSSLSIHIRDREKTYRQNEETKYKFVNIFNYVVSEIVSNYENSKIDKIVGDMHMIVLDIDESIDDPSLSEDALEKERERELARRAFLLSWNIDLVLRSLNKKAKEIFESKNIDITDPNVYDRLYRSNRGKFISLKLITYPRRAKEKKIRIKMEDFILYYYICKKFDIKGIQVRIGFNIGEVAEIFLGGARIDDTIMGKHVDLAARMEHLGKKNAIKFPARIYPLYDAQFKMFIIRQIIEESKLSNKDLTLKMVFRTKREYPKGYEREGLGTVEFFMEVGYAYYEAQKGYEKLQKLFEELKPDNMYRNIEKYVEKHKDVLIKNTMENNPKFADYPEKEIITYIMTHKATRLSIQDNIEKVIRKKIHKIIEALKEEYEVYHIVRTLVLNQSYDLYKNYFPNEALLSEHRKYNYFSERLMQRISDNIDFRSVEKDDLDRIVDELYTKLVGK
jgi:hypothetical protein